MPYRALLFDHDGVLARPPGLDLLRSAARDAYAAVGVADPDPDDVERIVRGVTPADVAALADSHGVDPDALWAARERTAAEAQVAAIERGDTVAYDDADLLAAVDGPVGVVSTNQRATVEFACDRFDYGRHVDIVVGGEPTIESLRRTKPAPHYLERALDELGAAPESTLFVGDSVSDVRAARRAGLDSVFLRRPHRADASLPVAPTFERADLDGLRSIPGVPLGGAHRETKYHR